MTTIFKYPLQIADRQTIEMPIGAQVFSVQVQDGIPCLWALVDTQAAKVIRTVYALGTGHDLAHMNGLTTLFISTIQLDGGSLVYHVFLEA